MILTALAVAAFAPSFDCAKASTNVEKMICADPQLAHLDAAVSLDYFQMPQKQRAGHRAWLKSRDACTARSCLLRQYESRVVDIVMEEAPGVRHYHSRPNQGDLDILTLGDGWYAFEAIGLWPTPGGSVNVAEVSGSFHLNAKGIAVRPPVDEDDCGWKVERLAKDRWRLSTLTAKQVSGFECYGMNATIDGTYLRRQRKSK